MLPKMAKNAKNHIKAGLSITIRLKWPKLTSQTYFGHEKAIGVLRFSIGIADREISTPNREIVESRYCRSIRPVLEQTPVMGFGKA